MDHANTFVLLIGSSDFPQDSSIAGIPNVIANLNFFKKSLINTEVVGIPETNISISLNENRSQIEKKLRDIANKTKKPEYTLLVYYTGHGILSSDDYQLYLTTHDTSKQDLEIEGINIDEFKKYIKKSYAKRKIVILDCCHSGAIINAMGDMPSKIQSDLNKFEGTYVMTSAAEDTPSLFPVESPDQPTYFTGKLIEILNEGMDVDEKYLSLRDIYNKIETDLTSIGLPSPQQSNFNTADKIDFSLNKKFILKKPDDETAWEKALDKNNKWEYMDFKKQFPQSRFVKEAKNKLIEIEDDEDWMKASYINSVFSLDDYMDRHPSGKYFAEANNRIKELREKDEERLKIKEDEDKRKVGEQIKIQQAQEETKRRYEEQLKERRIEKEKQIKIEQDLKYKQAEEEKRGMAAKQKQKKVEEELRLKQAEEEKQRIAYEKLQQMQIEDEKFWQTVIIANTIRSFKQYLINYPNGRFVNEAKIEIGKLKKTNQQEVNRAPNIITTFLIKHWKIAVGSVFIFILLILFLPVKHPMSDGLLNEIEASSDASHYDPAFDDVLDSINRAPYEQQNIGYVKKFKEHCKELKNSK